MADSETLRSKFIRNVIGGLMSVPPSVSLVSKVTNVYVPLIPFLGALFGVAASTFIGCSMKGSGWGKSLTESLLASGIPLFVGIIVTDRWVRIASLIALTWAIATLAVCSSNGSKISRWAIILVIIVAIGILVGVADIAVK